MKPFLKKLAAFLRGGCPAIRRRYDVAGDVYRDGKEDDTPVFSYAFKGEYTVDVRHILAAITTIALWCATHRKKKKK